MSPEDVPVNSRLPGTDVMLGQREYRVLLQQDEDRVFVAEVPSLPGCITQGATREEALTNVHEAIEVYVDSLDEHEDSAPT